MQKLSPAAAAAALAVVSAACSQPDEPADPGPLAALPAPDEASNCGPDAFFQAGVFGALETELDWQGSALTCAGGPRPDGAGARLRFANAADGLAVIVALPRIERAKAARELVANVTLIIEGEGRFFSTQDREQCWADVAEHVRVIDDHYAVAGDLYCIAPLAAVNGSDSITLDGVEFRGFVDWGPE